MARATPPCGSVNCRGLREQILIYWGDFDPFGFVILARLRASFPDIRTILMDAATFGRYRHLAAAAKLPPEFDLGHLTEADRSIAVDLYTNKLSLEQEKIPQVELVAALSTQASVCSR
jgi:hypothetical protein